MCLSYLRTQSKCILFLNQWRTQFFFDIDKDIVETMVGDMMYRVKDEAESDNEDV